MVTFAGISKRNEIFSNGCAKANLMCALASAHNVSG
jgi:hypothetical protein